MADAMETARRLLALALHEGTPEHERAAAALGVCRAVQKLGLLEGRSAPGEPMPVPFDPRVRTPDTPTGESGVVELGESRPCRACVLRRYPPRVRPRKTSVMFAGQRARLHADGNYTHVECSSEYSVLVSTGIYR